MIWTEWDPLKEMIIGRVYDPTDFDRYASTNDNFKNDIEFREGMWQILEETEEDFRRLEQLLVSLGVKVHRPKNLKIREEQSRMWKSSFPYPAVCPRDFHIAYGNNILSTIGGDVGRYFESDFFTQIMLEKYKQGRNYISMPKPLLEDMYKPYKDVEGQILYHSANILKCGDLMVNTAPYTKDNYGKGTRAGIDWVKRNIGYDVEWSEINISRHADGLVALIKPGVLMTYDKDWVPPELKHWDIIVAVQKPLPGWFADPNKMRFYKGRVSEWLKNWIGYVDETIFDINLISINPNLVITNGYDKNIEQQLKQHEVEMIPFEFRHKFFFDAGLHCMTLDLSRDGERARYH